MGAGPRGAGRSSTNPSSGTTGRALDELRKCFAEAPEDMVLTAPVYFDNGDRVHFGRHFYANTGLTILDVCPVRFGDNVYLGPNVNIYTAGPPHRCRGQEPRRRVWPTRHDRL